MSRQPTSFDFRESTRTPVRVSVELQFDSDEDAVVHAANLSPGGMFIEVRDPKPIGTLLRFTLDLSESSGPVRGFGEVVWIRIKRHGPDRPSGMGIRFRHLEDDGKQRIEAFTLALSAEMAPRAGDSLAEAAPAAPTSAASPALPVAPAAASAVPASAPATGETVPPPMVELWLGDDPASPPFPDRPPETMSAADPPGGAAAEAARQAEQLEETADFLAGRRPMEPASPDARIEPEQELTAEDFDLPVLEATPVQPPAPPAANASDAVQPSRPPEMRRVGGRPSGSARTSVAGSAVAEDPWRKSFLGLPSRRFLWLLVGAVVLGLVAYLCLGPIGAWLTGR
jgi:uncharacterized protein (TIGR02266 family)